jgi:hypothetical protein
MQVLQQPLMQRSEGVRYQPVLLPSRTCVKGSCARTNAYQDARARRPLRGVGGCPLIEARDGFLRLLQAAPSRHFHQGQQPQNQGQKPRQTGDRLRLPDTQQT